MGLDGREERRHPSGGGDWDEGVPDGNAEASRLSDLAHRRYRHLHLVDVVSYMEGELVGLHLGIPYDWDVLDPHLMLRD